MGKIAAILTIGILAVAGPDVFAGPYSEAMGDPANPYDPGIPGFIGPDGDGKCGDSGPDNYVNPIFAAWATGCRDYYRCDGETGFSDPAKALGAVTGNNLDVVSLGDLTQAQIDNGEPAGWITLTFDRPIRDGCEADFAVFENGFISATDGKVFAELGYVEVSTDAANWARFASDSLTGGPVGPYGTVDATGVYNLAGKHVNAHGDSWGTPFDLSALGDDPLVTAGLVNLNNINYVRVVDIPGSGDFTDDSGYPIYDAWHTFGFGGLDLEAVGAINVPGPGDANGDGAVDDPDLSIVISNWQRSDMEWADGDFNDDREVDDPDLSILILNWQGAAGSGCPVPEPATLTMLAVGAAAVVLSRRGKPAL